MPPKPAGRRGKGDSRKRKIVETDQQKRSRLTKRRAKARDGEDFDVIWHPRGRDLKNN